MPKDNLGHVCTHQWVMTAGDELPKIGDLFVTQGGTGYMLNRMTASSKPGRVNVVLTRVDHANPSYKGIPQHEWHWG